MKGGTWESETVAALRQELRARSLPVSGRKSDLVVRLEDDDAHGQVTDATTDATEATDATATEDDNDDGEDDELESPHEYLESGSALAWPPGDHLLNILAKRAWFSNPKPAVGPKAGQSAAAQQLPVEPRRKKLYCSVSFYELRNISPIDETFSCRLRLYLHWELDDAALAAGPAVLRAGFEHAHRMGDFHSFTPGEVAEIEADMTSSLPRVVFFNAISVEKLDECPGYRAYSGDRGRALLWNAGYMLELKEHFELSQFPFDTHGLQIELRQDNSACWDQYDLTVACVQFHRNALQLAEWAHHEPVVDRAPQQMIAHKASTIKLQVARLPLFYLYNVIGVMLMISLLGFAVFALPADALADRINTVLTLLLTTIAFKFVVADTIPKIGYNTHLDSFVLLNMGFLFIISCAVILANRANAGLVGAGGSGGDVGPGGAGGAGAPPGYLSTEYLASDRGLCVVAGLIFIGINGGWVVSVIRGVHRTGAAFTARRLWPDPNRNWYSLQFATPAWLPMPREK